MQINTGSPGNNPIVSGFQGPLTIDATAGGIALTQPTQAATLPLAQAALVTVETAQIRFTVDATAPTSTVGHILNIADRLLLEGQQEIRAFRAIRTGGSSGAVSVTYYRK